MKTEIYVKPVHWSILLWELFGINLYLQLFSGKRVEELQQVL